VTVVIPALNEEHNIPLVLEGLPPVDEVIVVDGGSDDDTIAVVREVRPDAVIIRQTRTGKGNALVCGFAASRGDIVVTVNADGSTDPGELPRFVDALLSGAEVAHGSRFRDGGGQLEGSRLDRLGNRMFSQVVNLFFGTRFTDLGYGYNAYWRTLLPGLDLPAPEVRGLRRGEHLWGDGPEIEPMINIRMAAQGLRVVEVASVGYPPIHGARDRNSLSRARRAVRAATAEYARRRRVGRYTTEPAGRPDTSQPPAIRSTVARSATAQSISTRSSAAQPGTPRAAVGWPPEARLRKARPTERGTVGAWPPQTPPPEPSPPEGRSRRAWPAKPRVTEAWPPQTPQTETWPTETRSRKARSADTGTAGALPPQARQAEAWPAESGSMRARREPGLGRRPDVQPTARHDAPPEPPRQRRGANDVTGLEPAPRAWPGTEDEESTGRHSAADLGGRHGSRTAPDWRRGYPEPAPNPALAEERSDRSYESPGRRHGYSEPDRGRAAPDEYPGAEPGEPRGRRAYPEPNRERRASREGRAAERARESSQEEGRTTGRRREGRTAEPSREGRERTWRIPDEPWRGTEEPWRGPDGEYHTGQIPVVSDDDLAPPSARQPDLTIISGDGEYESDYEGRDTPPQSRGTAQRREAAPWSRDPVTQGREGTRRSRDAATQSREDTRRSRDAAQGREGTSRGGEDEQAWLPQPRPQQPGSHSQQPEPPQSRHLRTTAGEPYGRPERR
jgi:hypothetical protein